MVMIPVRNRLPANFELSSASEVPSDQSRKQLGPASMLICFATLEARLALVESRCAGELRSPER